MLIKSTKRYIVITILNLILTYSIYYLTVFTIGHSLLLFALLQSLGFTFILIKHDRRKKQGVNYILQMISKFDQSIFEHDSDYPLDDDLYLVAKKLKDINSEYRQETLVYKQAQTRLFHILQNIKSVVILIDQSGKVLFINAAGEELFQTKRIDVVEKTPLIT